jgi:hypothetical protein
LPVFATAFARAMVDFPRPIRSCFSGTLKQM